MERVCFRKMIIITGMHPKNKFDVALTRHDTNVDEHIKLWKDWLLKDDLLDISFDKYIAMPTQGIVEAIEKICSQRNIKRYVLIAGEVPFYQLSLSKQERNFIVIQPKEYQQIKQGDLLCLSMPFSPFASMMNWYDSLMQYCDLNNIDVFLDCAYFGTTNKKIRIYDCVKYLSFSLSKPYGIPGLRAGILFCKTIPDMLKTKYAIYNYHFYAMKKANEYLQTYSPLYSYNTYRDDQLRVCEEFQLIPSDSVVLGYTSNLDHVKRDLMNHNEEVDILRLPISKYI